MAVLKNTKHEAFAQAVFKGARGPQAYRDHISDKGSEAVINSAASRLLNNVNIQARLTELKGRAAERVIISRTWVLETLRKNALIAVGEEKLKVTKAVKSKIADESGGFIEEVGTVEVEVTARDGATANRALELLGREVEGAPLFVERKEVGLPGEFDDRSDDELRERVRALTGGETGSVRNSRRVRAPRNPKPLQ